MGYPAISKTIQYLKSYGMKATVARIQDEIREINALHEKDYILSKSERERQINHSFEMQPRISILVPLYNTPIKLLTEMIDSVCMQTYRNWELCLADGSDEFHPDVRETVLAYCARDNRIVYKKLKVNGGISENTNACLEMASGEFIALFDHDDLLTEDALFEVVKEINLGADVIYTDEDKVMVSGPFHKKRYLEAHYKPDFNLDLLRNCNYICHFFVAKREVVELAGNGFRKEYDGSQDYDFILRAVEKAEHVSHIPKLLYHWRIHAASTAADPRAKMYCYESGVKAVKAHLEREGIDADVSMREHFGLYKVDYKLDSKPFVSIIVVEENASEANKNIEKIIKNTDYTNYEILWLSSNENSEEVNDTNHYVSQIRCIGEMSYPQLINLAVSKAKGDYLVLLNETAEPRDSSWLEILLSTCQREDLGISGAKIINRFESVLHCGMILGVTGVAGGAFTGIPSNHTGRYGRAVCQQNVSATADAIMVSKALFENVAGLNCNYKNAFLCVMDFCIRVRKKGYLIMVNPDIQIMCEDSALSSIKGTDLNLEDEKIAFCKEHQKELQEGDIYYNKNLSQARTDFVKKRKHEKNPLVKYCGDK